jgi:3-isopropylmalate/(R)-2-methylmalate dehydratase large subunit
MGMTMSQKILAVHAGVKEVEPGQFVEVKLDMVLGNDITTPVAADQFYRMGAKEVFDKEKIAIVPDHFTPNKDIKSAEQCRRVRDFANEMEIENYFEIGEMGIEHALLPEKGLVVAGDVYYRGRLSYLYLWRPWSVFHRGWKHRYGGRHGFRHLLDEGSFCHKV